MQTGLRSPLSRPAKDHGMKKKKTHSILISPREIPSSGTTMPISNNSSSRKYASYRRMENSFTSPLFNL